MSGVPVRVEVFAKVKYIVKDPNDVLSSDLVVLQPADLIRLLERAQFVIGSKGVPTAPATRVPS